VNPCEIGPCMNNGTCFVNVVGEADCTCKEVWSGYYCTIYTGHLRGTLYLIIYRH
jgi:hypothetical protein